MRRLINNKHGDMNMVLSAVIMAIIFAIGVIVIYNVYASVDASTVDETIKTNLGMLEVNTAGSDALNDALNASWNTTAHMGNATIDLIDNTETYFTVGPIALIVVAAVGILSYVMLLRRRA